MVIVFQTDTVHVGKEGAAFVVCRFRFRGGETAIGLFLIHHAFQPGVVHGGFGAEHHHVRGIQHFAFVKDKATGR
ncbi:hypothetical protein D3C75_1139790 [compost metagenome]